MFVRWISDNSNRKRADNRSKGRVFSQLVFLHNFPGSQRLGKTFEHTQSVLFGHSEGRPRSWEPCFARRYTLLLKPRHPQKPRAISQASVSQERRLQKLVACPSFARGFLLGRRPLGS